MKIKDKSQEREGEKRNKGRDRGCLIWNQDAAPSSCALISSSVSHSSLLFMEPHRLAELYIRAQCSTTTQRPTPCSRQTTSNTREPQRWSRVNVFSCCQHVLYISVSYLLHVADSEAQGYNCRRGVLDYFTHRPECLFCLLSPDQHYIFTGEVTWQKKLQEVV